MERVTWYVYIPRAAWIIRVWGPPVFHYKTDVGYLNRLIRLYHGRFYYLTVKVGSENENHHGRLETDRDNQIKKV
jgi:hypothetical protein